MVFMSQNNKSALGKKPFEDVKATWELSSKVYLPSKISPMFEAHAFFKYGN